MIKSTKAHPRLPWRLGAFSLLVAALIFGTSAAPAAAMVPQGWFSSYSTSNYVALGDSFTSGQGAPPYLSGDCMQSKYTSYPVITAALTRYKLVANKSCSGADTQMVAAQLASLTDGVKESAKLVTLTVGGIDAGSNQVLAACANDPDSQQCGDAIGFAASQLPLLSGKLVGIYTAVAQAMPNARIVVLTYPHLFKEGLSTLGDGINAATTLLNTIIDGAAGYVASQGANIQVVDVTQEFANHGIGSRIPYISFNPNNLLASSNFHPNALGNSLGYFRALLNDHALG